MESSLVELLKDDIEKEEPAVKDIKLVRIQYFKKSEKLNVIVKTPNDINDASKKTLRDIIGKKLKYFNDINVICYKDVSGITLREICKDYWEDLCAAVIIYMPIAKQYLNDCKRDVEGDLLNIQSGNEFMCLLLKNRKIETLIQNCILDMFSLRCRVKVLFNSSLVQNNYVKDKEKEEESLIKEVLKEIQEVRSSSGEKKENNKNNNSKYKYNGEYRRNSTAPVDENVIIGKKINGEDIVKISELNETSGYVAFEGDIFKLKVTEARNGKKIVLFYITDYTSSIAVKMFLKPKEAETALEEIKEGLHCKVFGEVIFDTYYKEVLVIGRSVNKALKINKMDTCEEKRVELHLHTTMSSMDGISSASKLVQRAAKWGHEAIAITDHGVVQAYPDAMDASQKYGIKVIYGVEAYLVDDGVPIVIGAKGSENIDDEFVVFDIETTGFSSNNDKIIEIGAVKIKNGKLIDSFNEFVNPQIDIPSKIVELTGITNGDVKNAETIEVILPKFMEFIGDSTVVAHNAVFDTSFIKKNCNDLNINFNNAVMDTIPLCKYLFPELKRYKLGTVAKHLNISLENHHRAVDDAKATGDILLECFRLLKDKDIYSLEKLNDEYIGNFDIKKAPTYHLIILAKNQTGIKNLYKLISFSHLEHFHRRPRMPKSLIEQYKEGLIIGSACEAGQIYKAVLQGKSDAELEELIKFYDYLEIQPVGNNMFMVRNGTVKNTDELKSINEKIYNLGKKYNKPVVATCDVHFMDPKDEVFRRILMAGQGFDDADEQAPLYFRTTQDMLEEFNYLGEEVAKEVVIYNTKRIANEIEKVKPIPDETFPPKIEGSEEEIRQMTIKKAHETYGETLPDVVEERLHKELNSIINNGYAVLYLIAQKLVAKSLSDGYLVGSRGSVGSSFVATMCGITEVNGLPPHYVCPKCKYSHFFRDGSVSSGFDLPDEICPKCGEKLIKDGHDIPFETFLGFNGDKEPDIDLNFSGDNQGDIHKYTEVLFGKGHTFKAGTIGTIADKTAYGFVKKYVTERNMRVPNAEVERLTQGCTGIKRTSGQHPGGIMVVPSDNEIYNFCPIQHPADDPNSDIITTHFDYHSISGRLLKLDILGHDDPTVLRMLKDLTGIDPRTVPLGDPKVMSLFTSPEALGLTEEELGCEVGSYGLPEFGTKFVRQMLVDTQPKTFSDLVRISGLSHGTDVWINNAQYYIKEGYTTLKDCIATRDDIMVYLLHKGLPPKDAFTIMEKVRKGKGLIEEHESLMREHDVPDWYIDSCKKIKYMFPKGHAVAYVMMAVRIAYFKVYYPTAYYATYFTVRADDFDADLIVKGEDIIKLKVEELSKLGNDMTQKDKGLLTILEISYEMYKRGIKFLKVDLYKSHATRFLIEDEGIRPPISALAGVGENAAKNIVSCREEGEFISKEDLRIRAKVSKTVIETLDNHGCLQGMPDTNQLSLF